MQNAIVISGRLVGPRNIQLDEPVTDLHNAGGLVGHVERSKIVVVLFPHPGTGGRIPSR